MNLRDPARPPAQIEGDLFEFTGPDGKVYLNGEIANARVTLWPLRQEFDKETGRTRRIWRLVAEAKRP